MNYKSVSCDRNTIHTTPVNMKTKSISDKNKLPNGFKVNPDRQNKYEDQPLFKDKVEKANLIIKKVGLPKN